MKIGLKSFGSIFLASALSITLFSACEKDANDSPPETVVDVMSDNGYSTLVSLAGTAGLGGTLSGTGPFTVFAPANSAFTGVTPPTGAALINLLSYHVIGGQGLTAANVLALSNGNLVKVTMANGDSTFVRASAAGVFVNGIQVTDADNVADNGVVHGIGNILFPPAGNIVQTAISTPGFDSLVKAVVQVSTGASGANNISELLSSLNGVTVFAPTNQAFAALFANSNFPFRQISDIPNDVLRAVLLHHAVAARTFSNDLANGTITMANGSSLTVAGVGTSGISLKGSEVVFNNTDAGISATNIMTRNGVIHVINQVLIP
jgi:uncharacterized surface protein with fasciclin (FAS1) repeats